MAQTKTTEVIHPLGEGDFSFSSSVKFYSDYLLTYFFENFKLGMLDFNVLSSLFSSF